MRVHTDDEENAYSENVAQIGLTLSNINIFDWKTYEGTWYGFGIKYPKTWTYPTSESAIRGSNWEYRYKFRKQQSTESDMFIGFDVVIYNVKKVKSIFETEEFPLLKSEELENNVECQNIRWNLIEPWDYPAEEIRIPVTDKCYQPSIFFSLTRDEYIYNIVAKTKEEDQALEDPFQIINDDFPNFFAAASTLELIEIKRSPPKPMITAPKPVSFKIENGLMVCAKKNDKPSKSKKNKERHLDMECCLDPDEYPNPWCYYDPQKYGKYF